MKKKPIRKVSKKRAKENEEYKSIYQNWRLNQFNNCIRCGRYVEWGVPPHHKFGRRGKTLLDTTGWLCVCNTCHQLIHQNPKLAREKGWLA